MFATLFLIASLNLSAFALGDAPVQLGISEAELLDKTQAVKVDEQSHGGHGYTDFAEENPLVYVDNSLKERKVEYYFHLGRLYKVMTIYRDRVNDEAYYQEQLAALQQRFGEPSRRFTSQVFSLQVFHHVWEDEREELDLRFGAGYVYKVIVDKAMQRDKRQQDISKRAI